MPLFSRKRPDNPQGMTDEMLFTSYQYRLAYMGRQLDDERARSVTVLELNGNYIVRSHTGRENTMNVAEFVSDDFEGADSGSIGSGRPTSYEAILGAIGRRLDTRAATNVAIIQTRSSYQIVGWEQGASGELLTSNPFEETIDNWTAQRLAGESS